MSGYIFLKIHFGKIKIFHSENENYIQSEIKFYTPQHKVVFELIKYSLKIKKIKYYICCINSLQLVNCYSNDFSIIISLCNRVSDTLQEEFEFNFEDLNEELDKMLDDDEKISNRQLIMDNKIPYRYFKLCNEIIKDIPEY